MLNHMVADITHLMTLIIKNSYFFLRSMPQFLSTLWYRHTDSFFQFLYWSKEIAISFSITKKLAD